MDCKTILLIIAILLLAIYVDMTLALGVALITLATKSRPTVMAFDDDFDENERAAVLLNKAMPWNIKSLMEFVQAYPEDNETNIIIKKLNMEWKLSEDALLYAQHRLTYETSAFVLFNIVKAYGITFNELIHQIYAEGPYDDEFLGMVERQEIWSTEFEELVTSKGRDFFLQHENAKLKSKVDAILRYFESHISNDSLKFPVAVGFFYNGIKSMLPEGLLKRVPNSDGLFTPLPDSVYGKKFLQPLISAQVSLFVEKANLKMLMQVLDDITKKDKYDLLFPEFMKNFYNEFAKWTGYNDFNLERTVLSFLPSLRMEMVKAIISKQSENYDIAEEYLGKAKVLDILQRQRKCYENLYPTQQRDFPLCWMMSVVGFLKNAALVHPSFKAALHPDVDKFIHGAGAAQKSWEERVKDEMFDDIPTASCPLIQPKALRQHLEPAIRKGLYGLILSIFYDQETFDRRNVKCINMSIAQGVEVASKRQKNEYDFYDWIRSTDAANITGKEPSHLSLNLFQTQGPPNALTLDESLSYDDPIVEKYLQGERFIGKHPMCLRKYAGGQPETLLTSFLTYKNVDGVDVIPWDLDITSIKEKLAQVSSPFAILSMKEESVLYLTFDIVERILERTYWPEIFSATNFELIGGTINMLRKDKDLPPIPGHAVSFVFCGNVIRYLDSNEIFSTDTLKEVNEKYMYDSASVSMLVQQKVQSEVVDVVKPGLFQSLMMGVQ